MRRIKDQLPVSWRLRYQLSKRAWKDYRQGHRSLFAKAEGDLPAASYSISAQQVIRPGSYFENKVHNLQLAAQAINQLVIHPGQLFLYWHTVGAPTPIRGYREGRNLINGQLKADYGGGLCQLSGIIYLLALRAAFPILERHHHSVDIYSEEERFCPLGADATVVYGYKDFRFQNHLSYALKLKISIEESVLHARLLAEKALPHYPIVFVRKEEKGEKKVTTIRQDGELKEVVAQSVYRRNS